MQNTGIIYTSEERTPTVLPELAELLPPLSDEQLSLLEADLLKNGCYTPIIVNEDLQVVDGHNRFRICEQHDLPFQMAVFAFDDLLEAKQWALGTQKSRRNLTVNELCKIAMKLRPEVEEKAHNQQGTRSDLSTTLSKGSAISTRKELANVVGVGEVTMGKAMKIEDEAPQPVKDAVDNGELSIHQGYTLTRELQELPEDERNEAAADSDTLEFFTAWSSVPEIIKLLSEKFPDQRLTYRWADEDIGMNVGTQVYQNGEIVDHDIPVDGSREAYEMAADIRGVSLAEYDLHLSKDGSTYEYRDPDEKPVTPEAPKPKKKKTQTPSR